MIAYYAMTKFHLLFSLSHKLLHRKEQDAILFLYSGLAGVEDYRDKILECNIYNEIHIVNEIELRKGWTGVPSIESTEIIEKDIKLVTERVDEWLPARLEDMDEIYIANDHWALGLYCIHHHIPYYYYEDGVGMLSKPDYSYELVYKLNKTQAHIAKYIGAFGNNEYVIKKFADLNNQSEGFTDDKACHYSVKDSLESLKQEDIDNILYIFKAPDIDAGSEKCTLVFTEHFINMKRLPIEGQTEIYTLLCDYFSGNNELLIKPHPSDIHTNYEKIFPNVNVISREFPSELLPFCMKGEKDLGLAACSTAVLGLKDYFNRIVRFDTDIENTYTKFHKYYAIANFVLHNNLEIARKFGVQETQLQQFLKLVNNNNEYQTKEDSITVTIVDDWTMNELIDESILNNSDCIIFTQMPISEAVDYKFWKNCGKEKLALIQIQKDCTSNTYLSSKKNEYLFIYAKDKNIIEKIGGMTIMKDLPYSGATINIDTISNNDSVKIKFLEAVLESTNQKLQYYIDRESELLNELKKFQ